MVEPIFLYLADVEQGLAVSRDVVSRLINAALLTAQGNGKGRRVVASSYSALKARIDKGENLWQLLKEAESDEGQRPLEAKPMAEEASIRMVKGGGTTSRRRSRKGDSQESGAMTKNPRSWLKEIT